MARLLAGIWGAEGNVRCGSPCDIGRGCMEARDMGSAAREVEGTMTCLGQSRSPRPNHILCYTILREMCAK